MIEYFKKSVFEFTTWIHENAESITAVLVSLFTLQKTQIFDILLSDWLSVLFAVFKWLFSIITAGISSYIVHELKTNNYNLIKMFKSIHKKLKKTKIKKRK